MPRGLSCLSRGEFKLMIAVVPDSGTGQLVGLTGTIVIVVKDGKHWYEFDYTLPEVGAAPKQSSG